MVFNDITAYKILDIFMLMNIKLRLNLRISFFFFFLRRHVLVINRVPKFHVCVLFV